MLHRHFEAARAEAEKPKPAPAPATKEEVFAAKDVKEGEDIVQTKAAAATTSRRKK